MCTSAEVRWTQPWGAVRTVVSGLVFPLRSTTDWLSRFMVPATLVSVTAAFRLFSQLTGPLKCTLHGSGLGAPGHVTRVLVGSMLHPAAARALTWMGSSRTCMVSICTTIGGGCTTWTRSSVDLATTLCPPA